MRARVLSVCVPLSAMLACVVPVDEDPADEPVIMGPCEWLDVEVEYGGALRPSEDMSFECPDFTVSLPSLAVNDANVLLSYGEWYESPILSIADGEIEVVEKPVELAKVRVVATADERLHLLGVHSPSLTPKTFVATLSGDPLILESTTYLAGLFPFDVAVLGDVLHVWGPYGGWTTRVHVTLTGKTWEQEPAPILPDAYYWQWAIDGAGDQLGYGSVVGDGNTHTQLWAHDGDEAWLLGESNMAGSLRRSVPPAVPRRAADPHLLMLHGEEGIVVIRPQPGGADRIAIPDTLPAEPDTICDGDTVACQPNTSCTTRYRGAAIDLFDVARSADGRLWVAWVEQDLTLEMSDFADSSSGCQPETYERTGTETVHLAEISLTDGSVNAELSFEQDEPTHVLLASHRDRLVLAVAEGVESRWRMLSLDLG